MIVLINLTTVIIWLNKNKNKVGQAETSRVSQYQYGEVAPHYMLNSISDGIIESDSLKGRIVLLNFFNPDDDHHLETIFFINTMAASYSKNVLQTLAVAKTAPKANRNAFLGSFEIPIIIDDEALFIHNLFHLKDCCGATVIIDETGIIRFVTPYLLDSFMTKQLVESQLETYNQRIAIKQ